jgi:DNA-binding CsgD family transcriptional regulator
MLRSDEHWLEIADEFYSAAVDGTRWYPALEKLAAATGSRSGELITVGHNAAIPINLMTNVDPAIHVAADVCRIGDPAVNPRVNAGMHAPALKVMAENDFLTPGEHAIHPHYDEFARPWDIPYSCLAVLERSSDLMIGLAVLRSEKEGHIEAPERAVFASLAPHVRAAVRMQLVLEGKSPALLTGTLESLSLPAFVCGGSGVVESFTSQAEEIVRSQRGLSLRNRKLRAVRDEDDKALNDVIDATAGSMLRTGAPALRTVVVRGADESAAPLVLDVMLLTSAAVSFLSGPRVLIVVRGSRGADSRKTAVLQGIYGFTAAETDIALQLAQGKFTETIAQERQVAVGTVRAQIKSLLAKLGVNRQIELVARLGEL